jgi:hypothetical protein
MSESYRALCSDFYVNQKLQVKLELPRDRHTVLDLFERMRRQFPAMGTFRRYKEELALESPQSETPHRWLAVRGNHVRSGTVNADSFEESYRLHRAVLEFAPAFLSISPLDIDCVELLFGFDLLASGSHDQIVFDTLYANSPLAHVLDVPDTRPIDCQPVVAIAAQMQNGREVEVFFEVKTRSRNAATSPDGDSPDPISVYLTLRRFGSVSDLKELHTIFDELARMGEELLENRVVPRLLVPLRNAISPNNS